MAKEMLERKPIKDEPIEEEKLSAEDELEQQISKQGDAEQVRVHSLNEPGTPQKYLIIRSKDLDKQVFRLPQYFALTDGKGRSKKTIGYQRWGETKEIQKYGTENKIDCCVVIGERKRGE